MTALLIIAGVVVLVAGGFAKRHDRARLGGRLERPSILESLTVRIGALVVLGGALALWVGAARPADLESSLGPVILLGIVVYGFLRMLGVVGRRSR